MKKDRLFSAGCYLELRLSLEIKIKSEEKSIDCVDCNSNNITSKTYFFRVVFFLKKAENSNIVQDRYLIIKDEKNYKWAKCCSLSILSLAHSLPEN